MRLRSYMRTALPGYLGTIALVTAADHGAAASARKRGGRAGRDLFFLGLLAVFPASDLAIALINRAVTDWLGPRSLPRLDLRKGIPEHLRTIVVMPILLTRRHEVEELVVAPRNSLSGEFRGQPPFRFALRLGRRPHRNAAGRRRTARRLRCRASPS